MVMHIYQDNGAGGVSVSDWTPETVLPVNLLWLDLLAPTREEEQAAEKFLGLEIPTREEMAEIEVSSRLYEEGGTLFVTATMLAKVASGEPETHAVTFIIAETYLITVRYTDTTSFRRFSTLFVKQQRVPASGAAIFLMLIEGVVNRQADILERVDRDIDAITRKVFRRGTDSPPSASKNFQRILEHIGSCGDVTAKIHESLVTFSRGMVFVGHHRLFAEQEKVLLQKSIRDDIAGLSDHASHLANRANFLLDATLGMITIQQNGVFRVLSIASLIFMPPTLVAGIYGMNFKLMPELDWHWGYPIALGLMLIAAILPLAYLRQRRWL